MTQLMPEAYRGIELMLDYKNGKMIAWGELTPEWWIFSCLLCTAAGETAPVALAKEFFCVITRNVSYLRLLCNRGNSKKGRHF